MGDLIDVSFLVEARRFFHKMLAARGIAYFLRTEGDRPYQIEPSKVELIVRTAKRARGAHLPSLQPDAVEQVRKEIRRELIRRVVERMLQTGL